MCFKFKKNEWELGLIPRVLHKHVKEPIENKKIIDLLCLVDFERCLDFVYENADVLRKMESLEFAFKHAFSGLTIVMVSINPYLVYDLLESLDLDYMREQMAPPPYKKELYTLFRGVVDSHLEIIQPGYSWTDNDEIAHDFAITYARLFRRNNPAVLVAEVPSELIGFYYNERSEQEFFVDASYIVESGHKIEVHKKLKPNAKLRAFPKFCFLN